jgi:hypothetical protein
MAQRTKEAIACHLRKQREELESVEGLPFRELVDAQRIRMALERANVTFRERIYDPMTTLYAFLSQAVASKDSSCHGNRILGYPDSSGASCLGQR